jgi:two-component system OmpR family response regulator
VEDDPVFTALHREAVDAIGGVATVCASVGDAVAAARAHAHDIVVLDRVLEGDDACDGLALIEALDHMERTPAILVVSALGGARHRIEGLNRGADDYLPKPFEVEELQARLQALARRSGVRSESATILTVGSLELRRLSRSAHWRGQSIALSEQGFEILLVLAERHGGGATRDTLWREVWRDFPNLPPQPNVIEAAIRRLRVALVQVIGHVPIVTVRGHGYRLDV